MKLQVLSFIMMLLIGGVITGNILGNMKNKTGQIVFFIWKGIQVFRTRVIPSNPQSVGQTAQRNKFTAVLRIAQDLLLSVVQPFWKPYAIHQSEYNAFMKANLDVVAYPIVWDAVIMAKGNLQETQVTSCEYTTGTGEVNFVYPNTLVGTQAITDKAYAVVYDPKTTSFFVNVAGTATRNDQTVVVDCIAGYTGADITNLEGWLWFTDVLPSAGAFTCSNSVYSAVVSV